jgi:hypothetical protein
MHRDARPDYFIGHMHCCETYRRNAKAVEHVHRLKGNGAHRASEVHHRPILPLCHLHEHDNSLQITVIIPTAVPSTCPFVS